MKRHLPLAAVLVLALASLSLAHEPTASPSSKTKPRAPRVTQAQLQKQLSDMETALWNAWKNKDPNPFKTHLSSDSVLVGDMGVGGGSNIAEEMKGCEVRSFSLSNWKMTKVNANTALLTYKATQDATCSGTAMPGTVWASTIWVKRKGTWQAAFHQETPAR